MFHINSNNTMARRNHLKTQFNCVTIQQYPICTRSDRAVYSCIEVFAYLLHGLLMRIWSTGKQLQIEVNRTLFVLR